MSFPRGVNQTYCSLRIKRRERELIDCLWEGGEYFSFRPILVSYLKQEVIYFDSYHIEFYVIQMSLLCKRKWEKETDRNESMGG